jgi:hypothetical protein
MKTEGHLLSKRFCGRVVFATCLLAVLISGGRAQAAQRSASGVEGAVAVPTSTATPTVIPPSVIAGWAVVLPNGAIARQRNVVASAWTGVGTYVVTFAGNVTRCVYNATIGLPGPGLPWPGEIGVAGSAANPNAVTVQTWNSAGVPMNMGFHLTVIC